MQNSVMENKVCDGEPQTSSDAMMKTQLASLEMANKMMREEFNAQRAKMKELYLQKECECIKLTKETEVLKEELNEMKSQIVVDEYKRESEYEHTKRKAKEEIASLQQLVHETIEESSFSKSEIDRLLDKIEKLTGENNDLRQLVHSQQSQDSASLAPVISQVKKTIARKLGADTSSNDYLEESMRKVNKYAQEDAEVLRSLVVPLEEEIKALKNKLRTTDDELQSFRGTQVTESALVGMLKDNKPKSIVDNEIDQSNVNTSSCQSCRNFEVQLEISQKEVTEMKEINLLSKKDVDRLKEDLEKEGALRRDLENQWQEKREMHKKEVETLADKINTAETALTTLQSCYTDAKDDINQELLKLTSERDSIHRHLETLQNDNDFLAGKYIATSEDLKNQRIDLPSTVEELQEILLTCHEHLIEARVGCEFEQQKCVSYVDEVQLLRDQLTSIDGERLAYAKEATTRIKYLESQLEHQIAEYEKLCTLKETFDKKESDFQKKVAELELQIIEIREAKDKLEKLNGDFKIKKSVLQQELSNSEKVQMDFVRLSQSLQMELEKIRVADTSVRWQEDEDAITCPTCKIAFTVTRRKEHCRHCGTIYCEKCLKKSVPSGQRQKPARVCDVCHTLLVSNTAPYFSNAPPHSPT